MSRRKLTAAFLISAIALLPAPTLAQGSPDSVVFSQDFLREVLYGRVPGHRMVRKWGAATVGTSLAPVTSSLRYPTPQTPVALEVVSTDARDNAAGLGAQKVRITGLDSNWEELTLDVDTGGLTPAAVSTSFLRVYSWHVCRSGTYADPTNLVGSQFGTLTLRQAGGGPVWSTIGPLAGSLYAGQSRIGFLTVPKGWTAFIVSLSATAESNQTADVFLVQRCIADDTLTSYDGTLRVIREIGGLSGPWSPYLAVGEGPFVGPCDLGFLAKAALSNARVSVHFQLVYIRSDLIPDTAALYYAGPPL